MFSSIIFLAASAATVAAQGYTYDPSTGTYTCDLNPNGAYCAGNSLGTNIIIRCTNGVGQPGNCNDNTAGYYPLGDLGDSLCYQTSSTSGDAACEKNCIVEGATGNFNGTYTLPGCTPAVPSTSSSSSTAPPGSSSTTITSTGTTTVTNGDKTTTEVFTYTTVVCPATSTSTPYNPASTGGYKTGGNATVGASTGGGASGPTSTPLITNGSGMAKPAGVGLAAIGLFIAYFI